MWFFLNTWEHKVRLLRNNFFLFVDSLCCSFNVGFSRIICSSINVLIFASTELFIESVDSLNLSEKMGIILPRTSGLVSASITCAVIVCTGDCLYLTDAL